MAIAGGHTNGQSGHTDDHNLLDAALEGKLDASVASSTYVTTVVGTTVADIQSALDAVPAGGNVLIAHNDIQGSSNANKIFGTPPAAWVLRDNLNYPTAGKGTGTVLDTASSVVVSHGCVLTPTSVQVTPRTNEAVWVSARTATTFTVTRVGTAGALAFDWRAEA